LISLLLNIGGLQNPILVGRKRDNKGIGANEKFADKWWDRQFDQLSASINVNVKKRKRDGLESKAMPVEPLEIKSALYKSFVKGESLSGTITPDDAEPADRELITLDRNEDQNVEQKPKLSKTERREKREKRGKKKLKLKSREKNRHNKEVEAGEKLDTKKKKKTRKS
jgi:nucleolar protein TMA23